MSGDQITLPSTSIFSRLDAVISLYSTPYRLINRCSVPGIRTVMWLYVRSAIPYTSINR